jgi:hypothetical protein
MADYAADYDTYSNYVKGICDSGNISNFKNHPSYTYMLEHVTKDQADEYIHYIIKKTAITFLAIQEFCIINDYIGNPNKFDFGFIRCSSTNLRYIFHAHLILKYVQKLNLPSVDILELGGGYGGLCLALHHFSVKYKIKINSYGIIDLANITRLQKMYLSTINPALKVDFFDGSTFGEGVKRQNNFLISNYCFSEITDSLQKKYIEVLFPKVSHGFMAWNEIPTYNFGFEYKEEEEYPKTGPKNKYVYF